MKLYTSLKPEFIKLACAAKTTEGILKELVYQLKLRDKISDDGLILKKLMEREKQGSTSIGHHTAVPHTRVKGLKEIIVSIGTSIAGLQYNETDKEPVHFIILILSPPDYVTYLQYLAAAASLLKKPGRLIQEILAAHNPEELVGVIKKYETLDD